MALDKTPYGSLILPCSHQAEPGLNPDLQTLMQHSYGARVRGLLRTWLTSMMMDQFSGHVATLLVKDCDEQSTPEAHRREVARLVHELDDARGELNGTMLYGSHVGSLVQYAEVPCMLR